jgi:pSer/pThr/pTyr-binding forkhead associated (FHA) protein
MEITCRKCNTRLVVSNTGSPIVKCGNCGYPNPVLLSNQPEKVADVVPVAPVQPTSLNNARAIPNPRPPVIPVNQSAAAPKNEVGWLVVHDENAPLQTYPLKIGRQIIGRKNTGSPCDIMITTQDVFMSRNHCILEVKPAKTGGFDYLISDRKMTNGTPENMSTNGTFVNSFAKALESNDVVYLNDSDTIQLGQTKLVIKTIRSVTNADDATRFVRETEYMPTVIIK